MNGASPPAVRSVVCPDNDFLKEKITASANAKPAEQAFLLPSATPILDNNFFVHREFLAWKYLAIAPCKDENGHRAMPDPQTLARSSRRTILR